MRQHRPRLAWFSSTEFEHLTILGSAFCWENQRELGLGSLSLLWPQEHRHTNYQTTSGRRSCPTQQGCHFLPPIPSSLLAVVPRGGWRALITACWLHSRTGAQTPLKTCQKVKKLLTKEVNNGHSGNLASSTMASHLFKASPWSQMRCQKTKQTPWMEINN